MSIERLKSMKECFMCAVESQMYDLSEVEAEELGEVVDMIKDLSEAIYYCTITEAMEDADEEEKMWRKMEANGEHDQMYYTPGSSVMYYRGQPRDSNGRYTSYYSNGNGSNGNMSNSGNNNSSSNGNSAQYTEREFPGAFQDEREGRSGRSRRMYMEAKETKQGKTAQMRELEKYMQELAQDVIEMVEDASAEEKQYLSKKVSALATKLTQLSD